MLSISVLPRGRKRSVSGNTENEHRHAKFRDLPIHVDETEKKRGRFSHNTETTKFKQVCPTYSVHCFHPTSMELGCEKIVNFEKNYFLKTNIPDTSH